MADSRNQAEHVVSHEDGWAVKAEGAEQPTKVYDNKQDAIDRAKEIAENKGTSAVIHKKDGTIQNHFSYNSSSNGNSSSSQGKSGENRSEATNKEYGRQGKYAKGSKN